MKTEPTLKSTVEDLWCAVDAFRRLPILDRRDETEMLYHLIGACQATAQKALIRLGDIDFAIRVEEHNE